MAVQFTIWDYWGELLLLTFGSLALFLVTAVPLMWFLVRRTKNVGIALLPVLLILPLMAAAFTYLVPIGEQSGCLYPKENAYTHTTAGTITALRPADHIPLYYYDGEFRSGVYLTIEGTEYYSMAHPMLTVGTSLHFTYCPEDDLIVAFSPIEPGEVAALQAPFVMPGPVPEEPVPEPLQDVGSLLYQLGFLSLLALILLEQGLSKQAAGYLQTRDRRQRFEVVPNRAVLITMSLFLIPFTLMALGEILSSGSFSILFLLVPVASVIFGLTWYSRASIRVEGRIIRIRRFGREQIIPLSTLRSVYWESSRHPFSQRQLVLQFEDGPLRLDQTSHLGLEDLHRRLSAYLKSI